MDLIATSLFLLALLVVLLLGSAFFSSAETALTGASRAKLHALVREGNPRARIVERLRGDKEKLIWTLLVGNNLLNILSTSIVSSILSSSLGGDAGVIISTILMTVLILVFGEILPKTYALFHAERVALWVSVSVSWTVSILTPITWLLRKLLGRITRHYRKSSETQTTAESNQMLRGAIALHAANDAEARHEGMMLSGVLDLDEVTVGDVMTHRRHLLTLDSELPSVDLAERALTTSFAHFPLYRGTPDNVIGILKTQTLLTSLWQQRLDPSRVKISELMEKPLYIPESTTLRQQLEDFRSRSGFVAFVVDEYGALLGMVTLTDILEEIVGDLDRSSVRDDSGIQHHRDASVTVLGSVTIRDLNRAMGWNLPDERAATIAGLVLYETRMIPEVGRVFAFHGFRFEILRRQRNQIISLRMGQLQKLSDHDGTD